MKKFFLAATVLLLILGAAITYGGIYGTNFVKDNLAAQKITFPSKDALLAQGREDLIPYADAQVDSGQEAKAFASYIEGHIAKIAGGQTYSEISAQYQALSAEQKQTPEGKKLEAQRLSIFMGESLRGTLLNAYGWGLVSKLATLAGIALVTAGLASGALYALAAKAQLALIKKPVTTKKRK